MLGLMVVAALQPWAEISERLRRIVLYNVLLAGLSQAVSVAER